MSAQVPSISECYTLLHTHQTPIEVVQHCLRVNQVAVFLAEALALKGKKVDLELVDRASLLHNMDRHRETPTAHYAEITARTLKDYPELAQVIREHPVGNILTYDQAPSTLESKIVFYADRRVVNDSIVPIETKLYRSLAKELLRGLNSIVPQLMVPLVRLEQELFAPLDFAPMDIQRLQGVRLNHDKRHLMPFLSRA
jgi:HD superfamily phosphohydrolase YqeK